MMVWPWKSLTMEELPSCFLIDQTLTFKSVFVDGSLVILSFPPGLSNGVAKVWGTGYLSMVPVQGEGRKNRHVSPSWIEDRNEKSTNFLLPGILDLRRSLFFSIFVRFFVCVFLVFMTKILKGATFCSIFSLFRNAIQPVLQQQNATSSNPPSHNVATEAAPGKGGVPDWVLRTWPKIGASKMPWKFPTIILDMNNVNVWILLVPNFEIQISGWKLLSHEQRCLVSSHSTLIDS